MFYVGVELDISNRNPLFEGDDVTLHCKSSTITRPIWLTHLIKDNVSRTIAAEQNSLSNSSTAHYDFLICVKVEYLLQLFTKFYFYDINRN